jgi:hypothetical protein
VKTTVELPESLLRRAKSAAAEDGRSLKDCLEEALTLWLAQRGKDGEAKPWAAGFGALRHLHKETVRINKVIDREFGRVEDEAWR